MKQKSFTLIELLVGVSIFVIVMVVGLAVVVTLTRNRSKNETLSNVQQSGNLAMEMMVNRVETATSYSFTADTSTLTVTSGGKTYQFGRDATLGSIWMTITPGVTTAQRLTSPDVNVTNLIFSGAADSAGSAGAKGYVIIDMTLQSAWAQSSEAPLTLYTTVINQL